MPMPAMEAFGRQCLDSASSGYNKVCKGMSSAVVSTLV